jgi:hypothetical protein
MAIFWAKTSQFLSRPVQLLRDYDRVNLKPDTLAGLTLAVIVLPQAIAYASVAELPPQMGLYAAVVAAIVGGLWGPRVFGGSRRYGCDGRHIPLIIRDSAARNASQLCFRFGHYRLYSWRRDADQR